MLKKLKIAESQFSVPRKIAKRKRESRKRIGNSKRSALLLGIRVITVESVNSPARDKMKNKLPFDVTPRGGARTHAHVRTVGSLVLCKRNGVHRNEIYEGRGGEICSRRDMCVRELSFVGRRGGESRVGKNVGALSTPTRVRIYVYGVHVCARVEASMRRDKRTGEDTMASLKNVAGGKK